MYKFSRRSINNMAGIHPTLITILLEAIKTSPVDFGIPNDGGVRTAEQQNALFKKEVSKCDGYNHKSNHQVSTGEKYGKAVDFYAYINGSASWDKTHLAMIAGHILGTANRLYNDGIITQELVWGGSFGSNSFHGWDYPHLQLKHKK